MTTNSRQPPATAPVRAPVRTIDREELRQKLERHDPFTLAMAGSDWSFKTKHIPGSIHIRNAQQVPESAEKDREIVVYCSNFDCHASLAVYQGLVDHGHRNVRHYAGGLVDWEDAGLPLEGDWASQK